MLIIKQILTGNRTNNCYLNMVIKHWVVINFPYLEHHAAEASWHIDTKICKYTILHQMR